ncbi:acyl-CoA dehydrogenase family protein [Xanthobacter dioxanivorans]|uniref:Acyl-CoA dehydrogenase family protein n=1 Tax=Xanthobacter dioxanivorans TaxID=2528964 RepID=A0A974PJK1_9HYPH|nr:acyl-CoA dehydrogenase family protein [Xanthobacter dioxanivorans]QRG04770.1 acyl-CoA dehydrogenase family protein [Xanthobacter dioxanivorans]
MDTPQHDRALPPDDPSNQPPPFADLNLAALDAPLMAAVARDGATDEILAFGRDWGASEQLALGRLANENPPELHSHDGNGRRCDIVEFHPAYHALMAQSVCAGLHSSSWDRSDRRGQATRAARLYLVSQVEAGHVCPLTMTHAAPASLAAAPHLLRDFLPRIRSRTYDGRFLPFWEKAGVTLGMGMTERQGGTDVRSNTTRAERTQGDEYEITGAKWFFSAPMSDAFLVLAQAPGGLTAFFMPRFRPDGTVNGLRLVRLKRKLGNRSNASSEVEFERAFAWRLGEEGRGIPAILEMVQLTRLDCAVSSAGLMRMALSRALHHARHRTVFQRKLLDQPAMAMVLADLALEAEGATALTLRLARSYDLANGAGEGRQEEAARARVLTPVVKFAVCKAAPAFVAEAMEAIGGNGYVEDSGLPRLYREAPVNAIWEGSGNVMALDLVRVAQREPDALETMLADLLRDAGALPGAAAAAEIVSTCLRSGDREAHARRAADRLAALATAAALAESAPAAVAEAYAATRLARPAAVYGANAVDSARNLLLERAFAA